MSFFKSLNSNNGKVKLFGFDSNILVVIKVCYTAIDIHIYIYTIQSNSFKSKVIKNGKNQSANRYVFIC